MKFLVLSALVVIAACIDCKTGSGPCCDDATNTFKPAGLRCDMGGNDCEARYCTGSSAYCPTPVVENGKACSLNGQVGVCQGTTCVANYPTILSNDQNTSGNTVSDSTTTPTTVNQGYNGYTTIYQQKTTVVPVVKKSEYDDHPLLHKSLDDADIDFDDSDDDDDDDDDDDEDDVKESKNTSCSGDCCNLLFSGAKPDGSICGHGGQCSKGECINQSCVGSCCKWMSDEALPDGSVCGHGGQCSKGVCVKQTCLGECCSLWGWSDEPLEDGTPCTKGKCISGVCMETNEYIPMPTLSAAKTSGADAKQRAKRTSTTAKHNNAQPQQAYHQPPTYQQAYQQVFQQQYQPQYQTQYQQPQYYQQQYQTQYQPQYQPQYQQPQYYQQQYYQPAYTQQQYQAYQQPQYYYQQPVYQQRY